MARLVASPSLRLPSYRGIIDTLRQALAKFAAILLVINDMLGDKALAQTGLNQLKVAFALFATNKQQYPLVYESRLYKPPLGDVVHEI